ncbi:hypothetical protein FA104_12355, partial [Pseudomonas aeruginosa]|nr:hypothetical protein [Pseudomonas aeruginosa]
AALEGGQQQSFAAEQHALQAAAIAVEEVCRQRPAHSSLEEIVLVAFDSSMAERYQRLLGERPVAR